MFMYDFKRKKFVSKQFLSTIDFHSMFYPTMEFSLAEQKKFVQV